ncbi:MAG: nickel-dependent hydrogenase large subunit [Candidatus Bipolaricaulaceae bacterium]
MRAIAIDPITRIEGHLKVEITVENGKIVHARSSGALFRGVEMILIGRHPLDAQRITTRICGVCPLAHSTAASLALDEALGISEAIPQNGRLLRNLIYAANWLHNHILHFYHLSLPDYVVFRGALSGFLASGAERDERFSSAESEVLARHYLEALEIRKKAHELVALFGGKMPHDMAIVPGGVTFCPGPGDLAAFRFRLSEIRGFLENVYVPDVISVARRYADYFGMGKVGRLLSFGAFPEENGGAIGRLVPAGLLRHGEPEKLDPREIREEVVSSWYEGSGGHPGEANPCPSPEKREAYSWVKAPRYKGEAYEVGPAARVSLGLVFGPPSLQALARDLLGEAKAGPEDLSSVMGRHISRAIEALFLAKEMEKWLSQLDWTRPVAAPLAVPKEGEGQGLTEAPRGALGHWLRIKDGRIAHYQVVSPTTWNASPRDEKGKPGPIEEALEGTPVGDDALLVAGRIVRSFDPCLACAVQ